MSKKQIEQQQILYQILKTATGPLGDMHKPYESRVFESFNAYFENALNCISYAVEEGREILKKGERQ